MLYSDSFKLLACETSNPNMSSDCSADALLLTLLSSAGFQYCKTVYFQLKSLETHPKQTKARNSIHHKNTDSKREEKQEGLKGEVRLLKFHAFVRVVRMHEMEIEIYTNWQVWGCVASLTVLTLLLIQVAILISSCG